MRLPFRLPELTWRRLFLTLAGLALFSVLVAWSGLVNVGASTGHWAITNWGLHWVMGNYTRTYARLEEQPPADLDDPARVRRAAGHFETACAFCHGSPAHEGPILPANMTPRPPALDGSAQIWSPRELSRIIRHGIKYTGMPAWVALEREDEVWAMVAFVRALPQMSPDAYRAMAIGPAVPDDPVLQGCARCHGTEGASVEGAVPVLAGQSAAYLTASLRAFATGSRHSGYMQFAVDGLEDTALARMATHYAGIDAGVAGLSENAPAGDARGARIAREGLPLADVPACQSCHGASAGRNPAYPRLAGQDATYLADQLRAFKAGVRGGTAYGDIMRKIAERLEDEDIEAVAEAYSTVRP
ncbi:c-type cytochrome [Ancylobacter sp. SL191]|uniref:c-type cytochrome n=1 Tax=Ancylobacter sp. SL191 TaxID=2995166 RepID=UPI002271CB26|nr:c-type cytochrome [Ancylobacter sp. SL191]WAC27182.1 c-type cytochrome [Ancylobacter sp. SL191]